MNFTTQYTDNAVRVTAIVASGKYAIIAAVDMEKLSTALFNRGFEHFECEGLWEGVKEASFLIPGMSEDAAVGCGIAFRQDAVLVNGKVISCHAPHTVTNVGGTIFGEVARTYAGYTVCEGIVWTCVSQSLEERGFHRAYANGYGALWVHTEGNVLIVWKDGREEEALSYANADMILSGRK